MCRTDNGKKGDSRRPGSWVNPPGKFFQEQRYPMSVKYYYEWMKIPSLYSKVFY